VTERDIQQVCAELSNRLQLGSLRPRVIGQFSNLAVALDPLPIVARIATGTALLRDTVSFAQREVSIAGFLAKLGAPVVPPCDGSLAGPHVVNGWTLSLWRHVEVLPGWPDAAESGRRLSACHAVLRGYTNAEAIPYFGAFDELRQLLAHPQVHAMCPEQDRRMMEQQARDCRCALEAYQITAQPLHGDSHRKNVFRTPQGPLWTDWEDTIHAPIEWDLACLVAGARITGTAEDTAWAETALAAYGPYDALTLELCIQTRALFGVAWLSLLAADAQAEQRRERLTVYLNWLRLR
jgi:Ser/Thr protein kinase RdoA (MazF antagonist)